ncbi:hypothetical protein P2318_28575 [Myxococcaceae bacterium GXIMD 01537]
MSARRRRDAAGTVLGLMANLLVGAGCVGEGRPLDDYLDDYERIQPLPEGVRPDGGVASQCSSEARGRASLRFVNDYSSTTVRYFWVDLQCKEILYGTLPPGEERDQETYGGHFWVVRNRAGELLREHLAVEGAERVTVQVP